MERVHRPRAALAAVALVALLAGCERPPMEVAQVGYRGTGMEQVVNPRIAAELAAANQLPDRLEPASPDGPKARDVYKNVQVLGDLSVGEFTRFMVAMSSWVAPKEGANAACLYCHNPQNFAEESKYPYTVSRRMIQMTRTINAQWKPHVAETGVTCYTCHRGQPNPANVWYAPAPQKHATRMLGDKAQQNSPAWTVALASLPYDPFGPYLADAKPIRVIGGSALPQDNRSSTKQAEFTYGLMMHLSDGLGVNCTYCHNTRSMASWDGAPPARATAWYGIRMVRQINNEYITPLTSVFPPDQYGPTGDISKVNCTTCHQGLPKPLYGQSMLKDHPELAGGVAVRPVPAAPAGAVPRAAPVAAEAQGRPAAVPAAPAPASAAAVPAPITVFFAVGGSTLLPEGRKLVDELATSLKANPNASVAISGFHSAAGNLARNQELAKSRAFAVRDGLVAAGIPEGRLMLEKPSETEANLSGEDPRSRRVDVAVR